MPGGNLHRYAATHAVANEGRAWMLEIREQRRHVIGEVPAVEVAWNIRRPPVTRHFDGNDFPGPGKFLDPPVPVEGDRHERPVEQHDGFTAAVNFVIHAESVDWRIARRGILLGGQVRDRHHHRQERRNPHSGGTPFHRFTPGHRFRYAAAWTMSSRRVELCSMPSVMPVETASSRASFAATARVQASGRTRPRCLSSSQTMQGSPAGMAKSMSAGSKYWWWTSFDGAWSSVKVPKKPNCLPSSRFLPSHLYLPPTRTSISHTGMSQPS